MASTHKKNRKISRKKATATRLGVCVGTIDNWVREGLFIKPIPIGTRAIGFLDDEIDAWLEARIAERDAAAAKSAKGGA